MDPRTQVDAARRAALAVHSTDLATLLITGKDRVSWLNGLVTCDLVKRAEGEARYGLVVARNGRVLSDVTVILDDTRTLVVVPAAAVEKLRAHLDHYLVMEDAEVAEGAHAFDAWTIHGPRAGDVLAAARSAGGTGGGLDRTGLGGAVVLAPSARSQEVSQAMERCVVAAGGALGDDAGWEALRLERAVPRFGADFDERTYPQEASLEKVAVSFDKGCYLGQEVVCMLELRGHVKRKLVSLVIDGTSPPPRGAPVVDEAGTPVGDVTSAGASPTLGKAIALAMVKRAAAEPGKVLFVAEATARVVDRPA